jgi:HPt (histidine-containing phosphotransfer) domain-containing protein
MTPVSRNVDEQRDTQDEEKIKNKLIRNFIKNNKSIYNEITKAIDEGDIKLAHRLVHTLKGNAGMLGKTRLQKASEDTENLLINEENRVNQLVMSVLKTELDAVLEEFESLMAEKAAASRDAVPSMEGGIAETEAGSLDEGKTRALLEELEGLLDGGDTECLRLIDSLRLISGSGELIQQIEDFEFNMAMETLAQLKTKVMGNRS